MLKHPGAETREVFISLFDALVPQPVLHLEVPHDRSQDAAPKAKRDCLAVESCLERS